MIAWHVVLFILVMAFLIYKLVTVEKGHGDYSFDLETPFWFLLTVVAAVVYFLVIGGIYWW